LNQQHYERCMIEYLGKYVEGRDAPNKRYIWFTEESEKH